MSSHSPSRRGKSKVQKKYQPTSSTPSLEISPTFKLIFWTVTGMSVLSLLTCLYMVNWPPEHSDNASTLFKTCDTCWKMGFGCLVGLLGGKSSIKGSD